MDHYFITGTSRGIGKALAERLLEDDENRVNGISRNCSISHPHYSHCHLDLALAGKIALYPFPAIVDAGRIVLVNNAAMLGETGYLDGIKPVNITRAFQVNLVAPAVLMNSFMKTYRDTAAVKIILNVSSGAGQRAIDGWSSYCASKAGLNMLSLAAALEQEKQQLKYPFRIFSIAPGIVDTVMQEEIRNVDKKDFSRVQEFIEYKRSGALADPRTVAEKYIEVIKSPEKYNDTVFSLR